MSQKNLLLKGYRLTTAEISYKEPNTSQVKTFVWQEMDIAPKFPILTEFLAFWQKEIEGDVQFVRVGASEMVDPKESRMANRSLAIH